MADRMNDTGLAEKVSIWKSLSVTTYSISICSVSEILLSTVRTEVKILSDF